jgi:hypothetical protein
MDTREWVIYLEYCPSCDTEMDFIGKYGQWYCPDCNMYHVPLHESSLPPIQQRMHEREGAANAYKQRRPSEPQSGSGRRGAGPDKAPPTISYNMIAVSVIMMILLLLASLFALVFLESGNDDTSDDVYVRNVGGSTYFDPGFPTIEISVIDGRGGKDSITVKHVDGDPLYWSDYNLVITNCDDKYDTMTCPDLGTYGTITSGERTRIYLESTGHGYVDLERTCQYDVEIYDKNENKRVYVRDRVFCE